MKPTADTDGTRCERVAVFGLRYVGLPLAQSFVQAGCEVWGADVSEGLVAEVGRGRTSLQEPRDGRSIQDMLKESLDAHRIHPMTNAQEALSAAHNITVTVGVSTRDGELDFSAVLQATETIARGCQGGSLILFRRTVTPGTVEDRLAPHIRAVGGTLGSDVLVASAPERISEGRVFWEFEQMPTIVSALDKVSPNGAMSLLELINERVPGVVVEMAVEAVVEAGRTVQDGRAGISGIAMKDFCSDDRAESSSEHRPPFGGCRHARQGARPVRASPSPLPGRQRGGVRDWSGCGADSRPTNCLRSRVPTSLAAPYAPTCCDR